MVPNALLVLATVLFIVGVQLQVTVVEEAYLLITHGDNYLPYARRTGRFLPGIGRLPWRSRDPDGAVVIHGWSANRQRPQPPQSGQQFLVGATDLHQLRPREIQGGAHRPNRRERIEVVPGWRTRRRPQGSPPAPRVVDLDLG